MKKLIFVTLALVFMLLVAGCGQQVQQPGQTTPPPQATPPPTTTTTTTTTTITAPSTTGRAVFTITDAAASMGAVTNIKVTVDKVSAHSAADGWVDVSSMPMTYDLLQLKAQGMHALLADAKLKTGTYEQLRLTISKAVITDSSGDHDAKLPSGELKIVGGFTVAADSTSTASFDFLANESLHMASDGQYILAPVVQLETRENAQADASSSTDVKVTGGNVKTNVKVGMNIDGNVGVGIMIAKNATLNIENGKVMLGVGKMMGQSSGRVVVTISDPGVNLSAVSSVMLTVDSVSVHSTSGGWMIISSTPKTYDLLLLKAQGTDALLADVQLAPGTYEQLRLNISKVVVADANGTHDAKLPSGDLKIVGRLVVNANSTSTAMFDFDAGQSLMITGNGEYVLAPVVHMVTTENANVTVKSDSTVEVKGGKVRTDIKVGMDENGNIGVGIRVTPGKSLSIDAEGKIKVKSIY